MGFVLAAVLACVSLLQLVRCENDRPIIGIVSEELQSGNGSYIAASYVKYIESAGGQVVPIFNNISQTDLKILFNSINGILFPGGGVSLVSSDYARVGQQVLQMAIETSGSGDYFPVWGTCLGFQLLSTIIGGDSVISNVSADNVTLPLNLTPAAPSSRLFSLFPDPALQWISKEPLTANYHSYSVTMETFQNNPKLSEFFTMLSTNADVNGVEFVSTMESKNYPVYGVQWHPEKNGFEWSYTQCTNHSEHAVAIMQYTANFFVQEARKSNHKFASASEEQSALIYNYSPTTSSYFTQVYIF